MKLLIKKAAILATGHDPDARKDILIENGKIRQIARSIKDGQATVLESRNLHVSPGWVDIGSQPGQPGYEYRETFASLCKSGMAGGYTALAIFPRTDPPLHSRIEIEYVRQANESLPIQLIPIGAVSRQLDGKDLTEMIDMHHAGARAFSDGRKNPLESGLLTRALEYVKPLGDVIIDFPLDRSMTIDGQMHEGKVSASMGLSGIPDVAEEIVVQRDIRILKYTGSRLHFHAISTGAAIAHIQKARNEKLDVTCDVPAMHLLLEDKEVGDFNSHLKVLPPLREARDRKALLKGLKEGWITHISSIHTPMEVETKDCEFTYASFGSVGLESAFAAACTVLKNQLSASALVDKFCAGPRTILGMDIPVVKPDQIADLTIFDPNLNWKYRGAKHSLSKNDALAGQSFTGKVLATIRGKHVVIN